MSGRAPRGDTARWISDSTLSPRSGRRRACKSRLFGSTTAAMAGWEVVVTAPGWPHFQDGRGPLRILGCSVQLESEFEAAGATAKSLAVSAEAFAPMTGR